MFYPNMVIGKFLERPNRFIAICEVDGQQETVHVKNTGKCKELLVEGATVYLQEHDDPNRKTKYSLINVVKDNRIINMDSQAPNKVVHEGLLNGTIKLEGVQKPITLIKPEQRYNQSRFDFYVETENEKIFIEVKGVTLEENGVVKFPDAKTERGVKHIRELIDATKEGYRAIILFVIQMKDVKYFTPNRVMHPEFADILQLAQESGVTICAYDCIVTKDELKISSSIPVKI